jgi:hypothetical protein
MIQKWNFSSTGKLKFKKYTSLHINKLKFKKVLKGFSFPS